MESFYANYFQCGSNESEVIIDFGQHFEGQQPPLFHTRIVTTREYALELISLLQENLARSTRPKQ